MLLRGEVCDLKFSTGTAGRPMILTVRRSSGGAAVRWHCGLEDLKSSGAIVGNTYQGSFARSQGADFELYNILAIPVGTLKDFSLNI